MNSRLHIVFLFIVVAQIYLLSSCVSTRYYKRVLYGEIKGEKKYRERIRSRNIFQGQEYYLILQVNYKGKLFQICETNGDLFTLLRKDFLFDNYGEYIEFMLDRLNKKEPLQINEEGLFNDLFDPRENCDSFPQITKKSGEELMKEYIDENGLLKSDSLYQWEYNCLFRNILKDKKVFIALQYYYDDTEHFFYNFKRTNWILTDGIDPEKFDPRKYMGLDD